MLGGPGSSRGSGILTEHRPLLVLSTSYISNVARQAQEHVGVILGRIRKADAPDNGKPLTFMDLTPGLVQHDMESGEGKAGLVDCIPSESKVWIVSEIEIFCHTWTHGTNRCRLATPAEPLRALFRRRG